MDVSKATTKTTALYARFSSDLQKDRSIDDQFAVCRDLAKREGLKVVATFEDRAKSGSTVYERDGLRDMMTAAKAKRFDTIIVESLDRLSRDQEDLPGIFKKLTFWGVEIRTLGEGIATAMHVGIRGMVGSMYLKDLGAKLKRRQFGAVSGGLIPGAVAYGYRTVVGKPGEREIVPAEADVVRRIFNEYAGGKSPRTIALGLTADGIPAPGGAVWSDTYILKTSQGRGVIGNPIYAGKIVWNFTSNIHNPETGKRVKRRNPASHHQITEAPHLRIIDQRIWEAANARREKNRIGARGRHYCVAEPHLLSGLLRCGECGGDMRITGNSPGGRRVGCSTAIHGGGCTNKKTYGLDKLQGGIVSNMRSQLTNVDAIKEAARAFHEQWASREAKNRSGLADARKRLARVEVQIDRIVTAITDSDVPIKTLSDKLKGFEAQRAGLAEQVRLLESESNVVTLHPNVIDQYRLNVQKLADALAADAVSVANHAAFRNLIDCIVVHKTGKHLPYEFTPYGRLGAILGVDLFPSVRSAEEIVAAEGIPTCFSGSSGTPAYPKKQIRKGAAIREKSQIVPLGRWREAA
jgi:site-specific DNA recombinase